MARSRSIPSSKTNRTNPETQATTTNLNGEKPIAAESAPPSAKLETKPETRPENKVAPEIRRLEVTKSETPKLESRKNLIPINLDDEIRRRAYELYQQRGYASGDQTEDWLTAESEVLQRYHQRSA